MRQLFWPEKTGSVERLFLTRPAPAPVEGEPRFRQLLAERTQGAAQVAGHSDAAATAAEPSAPSAPPAPPTTPAPAASETAKQAAPRGAGAADLRVGPSGTLP